MKQPKKQGKKEIPACNDFCRLRDFSHDVQLAMLLQVEEASFFKGAGRFIT